MKLTLILVASMAMTLGLPANHAAADGSIKLHPIKQYCVDYTHTGPMMGGTSKMCSRKFGLESYTISKTTISVFGITQEDNKHTIVMGKKIYNINPATMTGTVIDNPMYDVIAKKKSQDLAQGIFDAMDYRDTGVEKDIAGTKCKVFASAQVGTACLTPKAVMLEQEVMGVGQVATRYTESESGNDADYDLYKKAKISELPNLQEIMKKMGGG